MRKLLKRWYVWLGLVLLLGFVGSAALILANPSRITQANCDRIQDGMSEAEVDGILGGSPGSKIHHLDMSHVTWLDGPNYVTVCFVDGKANGFGMHFATKWETAQWYAKKGAERIGITWR
jgi:hypothetical protein